MKVLLINPPHPYLKQPYSQAPLGLMYIASFLRKHNVDVDILDLSGEKLDSSYESKISRADIYGLTGTVVDRPSCAHVSQTLKKIYPEAKVILGGPLTLSYSFLRDLPIDSFVFGEGESVILDIINDHPNLKETYQATRIKDLDSLPFPARDLIEFKGGNIFAQNKNYHEGGSTVIISSRGCYFGCTFCASPGLWGRKVSFRSSENVTEEIKEVVRDFGIFQFRFSDDMFTSKEDRVFKMCELFKKENIVWRCSIRTKPNSFDLFKKMYDGGCREVSFGIESGDQDVLDFLRKNITIENHRSAVVNAKKAGLVVRVLFMIGTPGESLNTIDRNISFLEAIKDFTDTIALTTFVPIPGSAIANHPEEHNCAILDTNIDNYNFYLWSPTGVNEWKNLIKLSNLSLEQLEQNKVRMKEYVLSTGKSNQG